jgi:WD repeat-containing protein 70
LKFITTNKHKITEDHHEVDRKMASGTTTDHPLPLPPAVANRNEDEIEERLPAGATVTSRTGRTAVLTTPASLAISIDASCLNPTRQRQGAACIRIGRQQATADIRIQHSSISRRHAILYYNYDQPQRTPEEGEEEKSSAGVVAPAREDDDEVLFLQSWGVTLINGQKQAKGAIVALWDGDTVQFGTVRENVFTIRMEQQKGEKNKVEVDTSADTALAEATPQPPKVMLSDQERLERAGEGLLGRDKRQAEIQAMMMSLDETPAYTQTADEVQRQVMQQREERTEEQSAEEAMARRQLATQYQLPVSQTFVVAGPDTTATTATGVIKKAVIATCLAVDPAGARFVVGGRDTTVRLYDFGGMDQRRHGYFHSIVPEPNHVPVALAYSNTGDRLLVATGGLQPIVLDRDGRSTLVKFIRGDVYVSDCTKTIGHTAAVTAVAWHPVDRDVVATAGRDGSVRLWDLNKGKRQFDMLLCGKVFPIKNQKQHRTVVTCLAFHPIGGREFVVGTECGSVQIWNRARVSARPERAVYGVHTNGGDEIGPIASVAYSLDGTKIATRSFNDPVAKVWDAQQLGRSASTSSLAKNALLASCGQAVTLHEQCNAVFDPAAKRLCLAVSFMEEGDTEQQTPPVEGGAIHIYDITQPNDASTISTTMLRPPLLIVPLGLPTGGTIVHWHHPLNQIFVACANGQAVIYFDTQFSNKGGAVAVTKKAGKSVDALEELLKAQKSSRGNTTTGPIIAPLHREDFNVKKQPLKRKRADDDKKALQQKMEPERPNKYKHKTGAQVGGAISFQQFVADQRIEKTKEIAGKDPRQALLQYSDTGQSSSFVDRAYQGNESKLADKTAEQEQEEDGGGT